jgi:hypothetical protein
MTIKALDSLELGGKVLATNKLDLYHFLSKGRVEARLRVVRFRGEERVNTPYEMEVEVAARATSIRSPRSKRCCSVTRARS